MFFFGQCVIKLQKEAKWLEGKLFKWQYIDKIRKFRISSKKLNNKWSENPLYMCQLLLF